MNVLITGAGRGIGRALALAFGRRGHRVLVNYRSDQDKAREAVEALRAEGAEADLKRADVSDPRQAQGLVDFMVEKWGGVDALVNNAGVVRDRTLLKMSEQEWRDVMDVNLNGAFWCLQAAARVMCRQKGGAIVNIASILGLKGGYGCANYAASKAGMIALTKSAARELGRFNVRVNAVLPGFHLTDMNKAALGSQARKIQEEHVLGRFPDLKELGEFVVWLSEQNSVSGQVFPFESRVR